MPVISNVSQTGSRVFLFLYTNNFWRDFHACKAKGVEFVREPREEPCGTVAVFKDLYGNLWGLLEPRQREGPDTDIETRLATARALRTTGAPSDSEMRPVA